MPKLSFTVPLSGKKTPVDRGSIFGLLNIPDTGASPKGSTYRKSLIQCPHEHGLLYEIGLRPSAPTEALTLGLLFHYALQRYYEEIFRFQQQFEAKYPADYRKESEYFWGHEAEASKVAWKSVSELQFADGYADTWAVLSRVLDAYFDHYSRRDRWRILAVEETQDLVDFYDLDLQILGQVWLAARCIDWDKSGLPMFGGTKINIASKQKVPILIRHDVLPSTQHLIAFERMLGQWEDMRGVYEKFGWPKSLGHCAGYARGYSKCQFYELCREHPLETVETIRQWRDAPSGFEVKNKDAPTFEDHNV
jgi:hypothetical protein